MNPISQIRERLGVTQAAMARGIGVSQGNVSNYERGQTMPPPVVDRLIEYAKTFSVKLTHNDVYAPKPPKPRSPRKASPAPP